MLEKAAFDINNECFKQRLVSPIPLDPYDLLECLECSYEWKYISPDDMIQGLTFFGDSYWYIWPKGNFSKGDMCHVECFSEGTVVINQRLLDSKSPTALGTERFVVTHEAAHWIKDKNYFSAGNGTDITACLKNDFISTDWNSDMTELKIIERQANYLAAAILMPKDIFTERFFEIGRYKNIPDSPIEYKPYMRGWFATLAKEFGVNFNPVKYRLKDLRLISYEL